MINESRKSIRFNGGCGLIVRLVRHALQDRGACVSLLRVEVLARCFIKPQPRSDKGCTLVAETQYMQGIPKAEYGTFSATALPQLQMNMQSLL